MVGQRRSGIDIIADILRASAGGAGKTRIMYQASLSHGQLQKYLDFLAGRGFITEVKMGRLSSAYLLTKSGQKLLRLITTLQETLRPADTPS